MFSVTYYPRARADKASLNVFPFTSTMCQGAAQQAEAGANFVHASPQLEAFECCNDIQFLHIREVDLGPVGASYMTL
jgi:hypothetical protein